jgi:hypothetical protein
MVCDRDVALLPLGRADRFIRFDVRVVVASLPLAERHGCRLTRLVDARLAWRDVVFRRSQR